MKSKRFIFLRVHLGWVAILDPFCVYCSLPCSPPTAPWGPAEEPPGCHRLGPPPRLCPQAHAVCCSSSLLLILPSCFHGSCTPRLEQNVTALHPHCTGPRYTNMESLVSQHQPCPGLQAGAGQKIRACWFRELR